MNPTANKLIHVGKIFPRGALSQYVFLRELTPHHYAWFEEGPEKVELETDVNASTVKEALRLAQKLWAQVSFRTVICGFRYTLPERDEHGMNALFCEMIASYQTSNGVYFDEQYGHHFFVQSASQEALNLWHQLQKENRL